VEGESIYTKGYESGAEIALPIALHDGNYHADDATLDMLEGDGRVAFRYTDNPNGAARDIAGILSENRRVLGMMPHPERASEAAHGNEDGARLFAHLTEMLAEA
jgi:phosphoribosylformylglycinamidine synthase